MKKTIKAIAHYRTSNQVSQDTWETISKMLELDQNTTIGEIIEWEKEGCYGDKDEFKPFEVTITFL